MGLGRECGMGEGLYLTEVVGLRGREERLALLTWLDTSVSAFRVPFPQISAWDPDNKTWKDMRGENKRHDREYSLC